MRLVPHEILTMALDTGAFGLASARCGVFQWRLWKTPSRGGGAAPPPGVHRLVNEFDVANAKCKQTLGLAGCEPEVQV